MDAERDIVALASCHVAKERIGESFQAVVVGVHPAGAFVRPVGFAVDGLVPRESIEDAWEDEVDFDEKRMQLQGYRTRQGITLGDELSVDLIGVDIMLRRIQFAMTDAVERSTERSVVADAAESRMSCSGVHAIVLAMVSEILHRQEGGKPSGKRPGSRPGQRDRMVISVGATVAKAVMVTPADRRRP